MLRKAILATLLATSAHAVEDVDGSLAKLPLADRAALLDRMEQDLFDGPASRLRNVRKIDLTRLCGRLNPKNRMGAYIGYRPFLFDPEHNELVLGGDDIDEATKIVLMEACNQSR